jgi:cytochrome b561
MAIILHWIIAALMVVNIGLIWSVDFLPDERVRPIIDAHKSFGISVLGLAILRILWRVAHRPPPMPISYPLWEKTSAHAAHFALYLLILALPISGWMHDSAWKDAAANPMQLFGLLPWPRIGAIAGLDPQIKEILHDLFGHVHTWLSYGFYMLLALHVGGALKHQFLDREPELQRMSPFGGAK